MKYLFNHKFIITVAFVLCCFTSIGQATTPDQSNPVSLVYWITGITIAVILLFMISVFSRLQSLQTKYKEEQAEDNWWTRVDRKLFTKAVPVEKEEDVLLDHDYDGIKELDNALPPWWKYGFYITIVIGVFYLLRFHVWKTGPTPEQEYNTEMEMASKQLEDYRKKSGDMVDEKTVTMADAAGIAEGKTLFQTSCSPCHAPDGGGLVGPNLTDEYWIHGGTINDIFKTIKYGVPDKGMTPWEKTFSPLQIKNLSSYIKTLAGTKPATPKAPQGDLYTETKTETKKDTTVAIN